MPFIVVMVLLAVVLVGGLAVFVTSARRARGSELEPPLEPKAPGIQARSTDVLDRPAAADTPGTAEVEPAEMDLSEPDADLVAPRVEEVEIPVRPSFRDRLAKARGAFSGYVGGILIRSKIDQEAWDDLEEALIRADVGVGPTQELIESVRERVKADGLEGGKALVGAIKHEMKTRLGEVADRTLQHQEGATNVWLFVGVNGVGKTTTIGKLAKRETEVGRTVVLAAGDTFRAAAAEQLTMWAERAGTDIVRGNEGADPSSIIFDAIEKAAANHADLVLADTAGRLHNKSNLMDELRKVRRVAAKPPGTVTETLLVLDATTGQNGLQQARVFTEAVDVTGVVLTKLDGSAKGGIVFAIQSELGIPVKLVGLGETADDLVAFDPDEFVEALFAT